MTLLNPSRLTTLKKQLKLLKTKNSLIKKDMALTQEEKNALVLELGNQAAEKLQKTIAEHDARVKQEIEAAKTHKGVTPEQLETLKQAQEEFKTKMEAIAKDQGKTLGALRDAISTSGMQKVDSIYDVLKKDEVELNKIFERRSDNIAYEIKMNSKGEIFARRYLGAEKAAYSHATIDQVDNNANVASIAHSLSLGTILRMGSDAPIVSQFRNTPYIFDLCDTVETSSPIATWMEELPKEGGSSNHVEGTSKPLSQYFHVIKSSDYKTEATLLTFTNKFNLDFARLQQEAIIGARADLVNRINASVQTDLFASATAYNQGATFAPLIDKENPNDFDAIAAMAAQAESATFGGVTSNAVLMSTLKKYAIGLTTDNTLAYINAPDVIRNMAFVGNPGVPNVDSVIVGDFKQYKILLRGGMIMRVGYNGIDFAENKFSVVLEQDYFNYISAIRATALVKGTTFATVKTAIATEVD
jgi:hypothetical protein